MKEYIKYNVIRLHKETTGHSSLSGSLLRMLTVSYFGFFYPLFCWLQRKAEQMPSLVGFLLKLTPVLDSQPGF